MVSLSLNGDKESGLTRSVSKKLIPLVLSGLLYACANAPVQEMSDARQAVTVAQTQIGQSSGPAAATLLRAQQRLDSAQQALYAGDYAMARRLALEAKHMAIAAREQHKTKNNNSNQ